MDVNPGSTRLTDTLKIAAVADIHFAKSSSGILQSLLTAVAESAEVFVICGDLTHHGHPDEAAALAKDLARLRMPILAVLGNHDYHHGQESEIERILKDSGVQVLDGDIAEVRGVGFAGVKGFASGFGQKVLEPWGESIIKEFVHTAVNEALKLESALARLSSTRRVALLHYSPVRETVEGEPPEIFPFLGSSRLEEPLNRFKVSAVFHGHAHHGRPEGQTGRGIPVYNVSLPLLTSMNPDRPPFRLVEVPIDDVPSK
jgi:Icc-related predicted phosphoesterase